MASPNLVWERTTQGHSHRRHDSVRDHLWRLATTVLPLTLLIHILPKRQVKLLLPKVSFLFAIRIKISSESGSLTDEVSLSVVPFQLKIYGSTETVICPLSLSPTICLYLAYDDQITQRTEEPKQILAFQRVGDAENYTSH